MSWPREFDPLAQTILGIMSSTPIQDQDLLGDWMEGSIGESEGREGTSLEPDFNLRTEMSELKDTMEQMRTAFTSLQLENIQLKEAMERGRQLTRQVTRPAATVEDVREASDRQES